ncbi:MAG: hypothetical protein GC129_04640 [Proteobacteria bacterium]|nr:hypothetical protein [Pseudomonadota bacterium]
MTTETFGNARLRENLMREIERLLAEQHGSSGFDRSGESNINLAEDPELKGLFLKLLDARFRIELLNDEMEHEAEFKVTALNIDSAPPFNYISIDEFT